MQQKLIIKYSLVASIISSILMMILFLIAALYTNSSRYVALYTQIDIIAAIVFVFILSMIVTVSLWPIIFEKIQ